MLATFCLLQGLSKYFHQLQYLTASLKSHRNDSSQFFGVTSHTLRCLLCRVVVGRMQPTQNSHTGHRQLHGIIRSRCAWSHHNMTRSFSGAIICDHWIRFKKTDEALLLWEAAIQDTFKPQRFKSAYQAFERDGANISVTHNGGTTTPSRNWWHPDTTGSVRRFWCININAKTKDVSTKNENTKTQ